MSDPLLYAHTRILDPATGDVQLSPFHTWTEGAPMLAIALFVLATQRGTCALDPTAGVDWSKCAKATPNLGATVQAVILDGFARYVTAGRITKPIVLVDTSGRMLLYDLSFTDLRAARKVELKRQPVPSNIAP